MFQYNRNLLHVQEASTPTPTPVGAGIYWNSALGLISISGDGTNWMTLADKNLGATTMWNSGDEKSESNCGKFFQWGNNYGFPFTGATSTSGTQVNVSSYSWQNPYSDGTFITAGQDSWMLNSNPDLWGDSTGTNIARRGPCPEGFHIPTWADITDARLMYYYIDPDNPDYGDQDFVNKLRMPPAGNLNNNSGTYNRGGTYGTYSYWYSNVDTSAGNKAYSIYMPIGGIGGGIHFAIWMASGLNIRPFKNAPVTPDSTWTLLWNGN